MVSAIEAEIPTHWQPRHGLIITHNPISYTFGSRLRHLSAKWLRPRVRLTMMHPSNESRLQLPGVEVLEGQQGEKVIAVKSAERHEGRQISVATV